MIKKWNNCPSCYSCPDLKSCELSLKDSGIEPREDDKENMVFATFDKRTHVVVKREDLQELYEIGYTAPYNPTREKFLARIKEEYGIEKIIEDIKK